MKTATVRELRNSFGRISEWINAGETVQVTKNGKAYAQLVPGNGTPLPRPRPPFDAEARLRKIRELFGDRVFTDEEVEFARYGEPPEWMNP